MTPPAGKCVWGCDSGKPLNEEHIIAKQVAKALDIPFPMAIEQGAVQRTTGLEVVTAVNTTTRLEITIKNRVCERCNGQWMNKLDRRMLGFLCGALRHGQRVQLADTKQQILAHWATKVALLIALWFHDNPAETPLGSSAVPDDNFLSVGKHMRPPDRTRVWIGDLGDTAGDGDFLMSADPIYWGRPDERKPQECGYSVTFSLRRMAFFVAGWDLSFHTPHPDWPNPETAVGARAMRRIWPMRERVVEWPPPQKMPADGLNRLMRI